jgi:hypothetical protein
MCSQVWAARSYERFQCVSTLSHGLGVHVYKTVARCTSECTSERTSECLVMLDQPHPSWSLVSHGDPTAVASFKRAMCVLRGLLRDDGDRATLDEPRLLAMMDVLHGAKLRESISTYARRAPSLPTSPSRAS